MYDMFPTKNKLTQLTKNEHQLNGVYCDKGNLNTCIAFYNVIV